MRVLVFALLAVPAPAAAQADLGADVPTAANQRYVLGRELYRKGELEPALREFMVAHAMVPDSARLTYSRGSWSGCAPDVVADRWYRFEVAVSGGAVTVTVTDGETSGSLTMVIPNLRYGRVVFASWGAGTAWWDDLDCRAPF